MSARRRALAIALLAVCAFVTTACGSSACEHASGVANDECGIEPTDVDPECSEADECAAQCVLENEDVYCDALRGDGAAVKKMDECTAKCG